MIDLNNLTVELTLQNLKTIKLWKFLLPKDRELTRQDYEVIAKIDALAIAAREQMEMQRRLEKIRCCR
jgi:hypothetical protein|tara:strand:- start:352 stop:555 length:204 start_codon:yes stop_codon:yes gene_type:complete